jgi:hypothetical protein
LGSKGLSFGFNLTLTRISQYSLFQSIDYEVARLAAPNKEGDAVMEELVDRKVIEREFQISAVSVFFSRFRLFPLK